MDINNYKRSKVEKYIYKSGSKVSKFKSTIYANILATSASIYIGLDLITTNWIESPLQHTGLKLFITLQVLIRLIQTVYTHRPSEKQETAENIQENIYTEKISSSSGDISRKVSSRHRYCPICQISVLDKDHHCWFLSTCISKTVGSGNHADFFFFLTWLSAALLYTIAVHLRISATEVYHEAGPIVLLLPGGLVYVVFGWLQISSFLKMVRIYGMTACFLFTVFIQLQYYWTGRKKMAGEKNLNFLKWTCLFLSGSLFRALERKTNFCYFSTEWHRFFEDTDGSNKTTFSECSKKCIACISR